MSFCDLCDDLGVLAAAGDVEITSLYRDLGLPNPAALLSHAKKHSHPDLDRLTYNGSLIIAVANPNPDETPALTVVEPAEDTTRLAIVDEVPDVPRVIEPDTITTDQPEPDVDEPAETPAGGFVPVNHATVDRIRKLADTHPAEQVRDLATDLLAAIDDHENQVLDRIRLDQLVVQADHLLAEIAKLRTRLGINNTGDVLQAVPTAMTGPQLARPDVDLHDVRVWARDNGYAISDRGRIPNHIINDYLNAHDEGEVS